jgi:hypothetical protein
MKRSTRQQILGQSSVRRRRPPVNLSPRSPENLRHFFERWKPWRQHARARRIVKGSPRFHDCRKSRESNHFAAKVDAGWVRTERFRCAQSLGRLPVPGEAIQSFGVRWHTCLPSLQRVHRRTERNVNESCTEYVAPRGGLPLDRDISIDRIESCFVREGDRDQPKESVKYLENVARLG